MDNVAVVADDAGDGTGGLVDVAMVVLVAAAADSAAVSTAGHINVDADTNEKDGNDGAAKDAKGAADGGRDGGLGGTCGGARTFVDRYRAMNTLSRECMT